MTSTVEILSKIKTYGVFKYSVWKIVRLLNILPEQVEEFIAEFENENSTLRRHYEQGVAMGEHNISVALMKEAEDGNVLAVHQLEEQMEKRKTEALRKELFGV